MDTTRTHVRREQRSLTGPQEELSSKRVTWVTWASFEDTTEDAAAFPAGYSLGADALMFPPNSEISVFFDSPKFNIFIQNGLGPPTFPVPPSPHHQH